MTGGPWLPMLLVAGAYLAMFSIGELLRQQRRIAAGVTRKVDHVAAGGIALALPILFDSPWPVIALGVPFLSFLLGTMLLGRLDSVHAVPGRSAGAFLYPAAIAATFLIASDNYAWYAIAVLALALGDPAGGIVGARSASHTYLAWGHAKTWEGSLAVLLVTSVVTGSILALAGSPPIESCLTGVFTGFVVALVEGALPWGIDNLGIPLAALASLGAVGSVPTGGTALFCAAALLALAVAAPRLWRRRRKLPTSAAVVSHAR